MSDSSLSDLIGFKVIMRTVIVLVDRISVG